MLITIDTEYSSGLYARGAAMDCDSNYARCLDCRTDNGAVGISYQMDVMEREGLRGVFFVDPMPALVWGVDAVSRIVDPILTRGHEVQLHLHTEWLEYAERNPLGDRTGWNLADFTFDEQVVLIDYAASQLVAAGAPRPTAFRAGNYGANDDTLRALARLGIFTDTSFPPGMAQSDCDISIGQDNLFPAYLNGVLEVPIGAIGARGGRRRHAQLTALSLQELKAAIIHASDLDWPAFVLVSHSFEMMNRERGIANRLVQRRFEQLCEWLGSQPKMSSAGFRDGQIEARLANPVRSADATVLPHHPFREALRMSEQAISNMVYG